MHVLVARLRLWQIVTLWGGQSVPWTFHVACFWIFQCACSYQVTTVTTTQWWSTPPTGLALFDRNFQSLAISYEPKLHAIYHENVLLVFFSGVHGVPLVPCVPVCLWETPCFSAMIHMISKYVRRVTWIAAPSAGVSAMWRFWGCQQFAPQFHEGVRCTPHQGPRCPMCGMSVCTGSKFGIDRHQKPSKTDSGMEVNDQLNSVLSVLVGLRHVWNVWDLGFKDNRHANVT